MDANSIIYLSIRVVHERTEFTIMTISVSEVLPHENKKIQHQNVTLMSIEPGPQPFRSNALLSEPLGYP